MFSIIAPYKYAYLLKEEFLVDNIYDSSVNNRCKLTFLFKGIEDYKDTQMKAYYLTAGQCTAQK